jgi:hypothetical protein
MNITQLAEAQTTTMIKQTLAILCLSMLAFSCVKEDETVADSMRILWIQYEDYSMTNPDGGDWDDPPMGASTGPDIYFKVVESDGSETVSDIYFPDVDGEILLFEESSGLPITIDNPGSTLKIQFWDQDDLDASDAGTDDDLVNGIGFRPWADGDDLSVDELVVQISGVTLTVGVEFIGN